MAKVIISTCSGEQCITEPALTVSVRLTLRPGSTPEQTGKAHEDVPMPKQSNSPSTSRSPL
jgi:hypothetical protein